MQLSHDIHKLNGELPETMSGKTSAINKLFDLEWFEFVILRDIKVFSADKKIRVARYQESSINVGLAMMVMIVIHSVN